MSSRSVSIILSPFKVRTRVKLQLLRQREVVEFSSQGKLAVDFFLAEAEVGDIEEAYASQSVGVIS